MNMVRWNDYKKISRWLHTKGFFSLLSANFLIQFLGFGTTLVVARLLTATELGQIRIMQSYGGFFLIPAGLGLSTSILKFCAEDRDPSEKQYMLKAALMRSLPACLIAFTVLCVLTLTGVMTASSELRPWLLGYAAVSIPVSTATGILIVYLQALRKIHQMARAQVVIRLQSVALVILCTWRWGFTGFFWATLIGLTIGFAPLLWNVGLGFLRATKAKLPSRFMQVAWFSVLGTSITAIGQYVDVFLLDHSAVERASIGYYSLALTFATAAMLVTGTVQTIVTPYFSQHADDQQWVARHLRTQQLRMVALSIGVAAILLLGAAILIRNVYAPEYGASIGYLVILLVKYIVWSATAVIGGAFVGLGLIRYGFLLVCATTPLGIACSYLLLRKWGVPGVAWGQVFTSMAGLVLTMATYRRALSSFFRRRHTMVADAPTGLTET
jgi:O-antigen/teichoic acid export membrane protein